MSKLSWYKNYLEGYFEYFKLLKHKHILTYLKSLYLDKNKNYLVYHPDPELLKIFTVYYLCLEVVNFEVITARSLVDNIMKSNDITKYKELLIILNDKNPVSFGNSYTFLQQHVTSVVTERLRRNERVLVLTEKFIPVLRESNELTYIALDNIDTTLNNNNKNYVGTMNITKTDTQVQSKLPSNTLDDIFK